MGRIDWEAPHTEEGLQQVLRQLRQCRENGNLVEVGHGLLALSFLVKWVRSDTDSSPFDRSHELAVEAAETFRSTDCKEGLVDALVAASALAAPDERMSYLNEAESLAETLDKNYKAKVLAARARGGALSDKSSSDLHRQALAIFRQTGDQQGLARTLLGLALGDGEAAEKRDYALEAAQICQSLGQQKDASMGLMLAFMNAEEITPLIELESMARDGLSHSLNHPPGAEGFFRTKLAAIAALKGDFAEAEEHRQRDREIREADGLTPQERWEDEVEITKMIISMADKQGHAETADVFREELERLEESRPAGV